MGSSNPSSGPRQLKHLTGGREKQLPMSQATKIVLGTVGLSALLAVGIIVALALV